MPSLSSVGCGLDNGLNQQEFVCWNISNRPEREAMRVEFRGNDAVPDLLIVDCRSLALRICCILRSHVTLLIAEQRSDSVGEKKGEMEKLQRKSVWIGRTFWKGYLTLYEDLVRGWS